MTTKAYRLPKEEEEFLCEMHEVDKKHHLNDDQRDEYMDWRFKSTLSKKECLELALHPKKRLQHSYIEFNHVNKQFYSKLKEYIGTISKNAVVYISKIHKNNIAIDGVMLQPDDERAIRRIVDKMNQTYEASKAYSHRIDIYKMEFNLMPDVF